MQGRSIKSKGTVEAVAVANGDDAYADAVTGVTIAGADRAVVRTVGVAVERDGVVYDSSVTRFRAVDRADRDSDTLIVVDRQITYADGQKTVTKSKVVFENGEEVSSKTSVKIKPMKHQIDDDEFDVDGNTAAATFDASAVGENTLVVVDAYALAVEDELSQSTVMITSAAE